LALSATRVTDELRRHYGQLRN